MSTLGMDQPLTSRQVIEAAGHRLWIAPAVLLGMLQVGLGTTWDVHWHATVGRDSFWIPPHLVVHSGTLLTLTAVLVGFMLEGGQAGAEQVPSRAGPFGLRAPAGLWLSGVGVTWFLASAPFDDLWHRLFGLDVTLWSPPHLSLMGAAWAIMLGVLLLLLQERRRLDVTVPERSARRKHIETTLIVLTLGFLAQPPSLALAPGLRYSYLQPGPLGPWLLPGLMAVVLPAVLFLAPSALRRPAGLAVPALVQLLLRPLGVGFAALGYAIVFPQGVPADSPIPGVTGQTVAVGLAFVPLLLLAPALLGDLALLLSCRQRAGWMIAALVVGASLAVEGVFVPSAFGYAGAPLGSLVVAVPALALIAVPSAWLGRCLGRMLSPG